MPALQGIWICLSPIVLLVGMALMVDKEKQDLGISFGASLITVIPLWWALYFVIRDMAAK